MKQNESGKSHGSASLKVLTKKAPDTHCNARTRAGGYCCKSAGWGTNHVGEGRCRLHGGNAGRPLEHGRRSRYGLIRLRHDLLAIARGEDPPLEILCQLPVGELKRRRSKRELS